MATLANEDAPPPRDPARKVRSRFFANAAILMALMIFATFARTYFIPLATGSDQFVMLRHVHGAVFFAWTLLYVLQANLVAAGRIRLHRELGLAVVAVSGMMVPLGFWMAMRGTEEKIAKGMKLPFEGAGYNLFDLSTFAAAMAGAIYFAMRDIEWHRRLVYLAAICLLGPAISRWAPFVPLEYPWLDALPNIVADLFLVALAIYDRRTLGRIHPVTLWSMVVLIPFNLFEPLFVRSAWWTALGPHLYGFT